jgi:hypothetical protein
MESCPSWEANSCSATQEFSNILWNTNVYCRLQKSPPLALILSQMNPFYNILSYLSKIYFNIIFPPTSTSS